MRSKPLLKWEVWFAWRPVWLIDKQCWAWWENVLAHRYNPYHAIREYYSLEYSVPWDSRWEIKK